MQSPANGDYLEVWFIRKKVTVLVMCFVSIAERSQSTLCFF